MKTTTTKTTRLIALLSASVLGAGCATAHDADEASSTAPTTSTPTAPTEQASASPRLALSYDGGVLVVDATTLEQVADIPVEGFTRLNSGGNGRHVLVSQSDGFAVLDMGTWTDAHGDHGHHYTASPKVADIRLGGAEPGHVVSHDGMLTLFSDGTGAVDVIDAKEMLDGAVKAQSTTTREPHHGVAVARADGSTVVSVGDEETRSGVVILDAAGNEIAANGDCPGLHGEAAAAAGVLTFGCENGILMLRGNDIRKIASPDA